MKLTGPALRLPRHHVPCSRPGKYPTGLILSSLEVLMKVKLTMDRNASSSKKSSAVQKINRDLGAKASIAGDVITVDSGNDEKKVIDILDREGVSYSKSGH